MDKFGIDKSELEEKDKKDDYCSSIASTNRQVYDGVEDHSSLIKRRKIVKGKINKEEYQELRKAIGIVTLGFCASLVQSIVFQSPLF
jgi:hypothetical protein